MLSINSPSNAPQVNDAISSPTTIIAVLLSLKPKAIKIKIVPHAILTIRDVLMLCFFLNQSVTVEEANEFTEELSVDIAAERTPASKSPLPLLAES